MQHNATTSREITATELKAIMDQGDDFQLIDLREPMEKDIVDIGGMSLPLDELIEKKDQIARDKKVILYCKGGDRSEKAVRYLASMFQLRNLYYLKGGIMAFAEEIDPGLATY